MRFEVLGPIQIIDDGGQVSVSEQRRLLLAVLLIRGNRRVSAGALAEVLWGLDGWDPPARPDKSLQMHILRLRKVLDRPDRLQGVDDGYLLEVGAEELDAQVFVDLHVAARQAAMAGDLVEAARLYREALDLWRGEPYEDIEEPSVVPPERTRLAELRLVAYEELYDAELARGAGPDIVPELTELARRYPLRERLTGHLMRALYRSGRQTRAVASYRKISKRMAEQLGSRPGAELRGLYERISAEDPALLHRPMSSSSPAVASAATSAGPPAQLPPVPSGFTGRTAELAELERAHVAEGAGLIVVTGMAGVGKTSLAVRFADVVVDRFGDGQLYIDLRGHAAGPALAPIEALTRLLRGLGADPRRIPSDVEVATAEFRSMVAGRKVLVLLDNAASADQVRPLLAGTAGCLALVTSRHQLSGLVAREGAYRLPIGTLPASDGRELLLRLVGSDRGEPDAMGEVVAACAGLPLALRIAAAQVADQPHRPLADYLAELRDAPLSSLELDDDPQSAVALAFDLSYQRLDVDAQRLFRLLGLIPGPDFTVDAAAALNGISVYDAGRRLRQLVSAHLAHEHAAGRYRFHDLLGEFAGLRAEAEEPAEQREQALERLFAWYCQGKNAVAASIRENAAVLPPPPLPADLPPIEFDAASDGVQWLEAEHGNIDAAIRSAAGHRLAPWSWQLAQRYAVTMAGRGHLANALASARVATEAARIADDQTALAHMLSELGNVLARTDTEQAIATLMDALRLAEQLEDHALRGRTLNSLGVYYQNLGDLDTAESCLTRALAVKRAFGESKRSEASTLNNLARLASSRGQLRQGARAWEAVVDLLQGSPSSTLQISLTNLIVTRFHLGDLDGIFELFDRAEQVATELGDSDSLVRAKQIRAELHVELGHYDEALDRLAILLPEAKRIGHHRLRAQLQITMGMLRLRTRQPGLAIAAYEHAAAVSRQAGSREIETRALHGMAEAHTRLGRMSSAESLARQALEAARNCDRVCEGNALALTATIELATGREADAIANAQHALQIQQETGHLLAQARALRALGEALRATGDVETANTHLREAKAKFEKFGSPEAEQIRLWVDQQPSPSVSEA